MANCYMMEGQLDSATYYANLAQNNLGKVENSDQLDSYILNQSIAFRMDSIHKCNQYGKKAMLLGKMLNDSNSIVDSYFMLAQCESKSGSTATGLMFLEQARPFLTSEAKRAAYHLIKGMFFYTENNLNNALDEFERAHSLASKINDGQTVFISKLNIGNIHLDQKSFVDARKYFLEGLKQAEQMNLAARIPRLHVSLSKTFESGAKKIEHLSIAWKAIEQGQLRDIKKMVLEDLIVAHKKESNWRETVFFQEQLLLHQDSIERKQQEASTDVIKTQLIQEKSNEITELKQTAEEQKNKSRLFSGLALLLLGGLCFVFWKWKRQQKLLIDLNADKVQLKKSFEKSTMSLGIHKDLVSHLKFVLGSSITAEELVQSLINNKQTNGAQTWSTYVAKFELIYPLFFKTLINKYPSLNQNELKICSLVKLQLNNHQISELLFVGAEAIKKSKQRIRKKMEVSTNGELEAFLISL